MPTIDTADAIRFLKFLGQSRPGVYTLRPNDQWPNFRAVTPANLQSILQEHVNTYYSVAIPKPNLSKKAGKDELAATQFLHVDLDPQDGVDPNAELSRLYTLVTDGRPGNIPPPSAIVESGRGIQCLWKLAAPLALPEHLEAVESANRWLIDQLHAPLGTHNADRIMRLPGSWNALDPKKLAKGYQPRQAVLLEINDRVYTIGDFGKWDPKKSVSDVKPSASSGSKTAEDVSCEIIYPGEDLDKFPDLPARVKWLIANGAPADRTQEYEELFGKIAEGRDPYNKNGWVYDVINQCIRFKVPDGDILGYLLDKRCRISEHIYNQNDPEYAARRQVARGHNTVAKDEPRNTPSNEASSDEVDTDEEPELLWEVDNESKLPVRCSHNMRVAFQKMGVRLMFDNFANTAFLLRDDKAKPLQDSDVIALWFEIEERFKVQIGKDKFSDLVQDEARKRSFHPVREYLDGLVWDGVPRLDTWLIEYGGAEDSAYTRAVGMLPLVAAVRRIKEPGADFQEILTLVSSKQGTYKSTAIRTLCPKREWFSDDLPMNSESQQIIERLQGHWIIECAETKGMKKGGDEHTKAFLSRQVDEARLAYGRITTRCPRQCVFIATSNDEKLLRDPTGNRRWWPVVIKIFDTKRLAADRDQLWAEAVQRELTIGPEIKLDPSLYEAAGAVQEAHTVDHPFIDTLARALDGMWGKILVADAWDIATNAAGTGRSHDQSIQLGQAMKKLGWERDKQRQKGKSAQNCFVKDLQQADGSSMPGKNGDWIHTARRKTDGRVVAAYEADLGQEAELYADAF